MVKPWDYIFPIVKHRHLIKQLTKRDFREKFSRSRLGLLWVIASPVLLLAGYTLVFGVFLKARWGGAGSNMEFALVLYSGLLFYNFFSEVIAKSTNLIHGNQPYVKKMVFPLEVLNVSLVISSCINFIIGVIIWVIFSFLIRGHIPLTIAWLPAIFIPFAIFTLGCSWLLSSYAAFNPDVEHVVPITLLLMMFISPLFFSIESIPPEFRKIMYLNPLSYVLEEGRMVLISGKTPHLQTLAIGWATALCVAWIGYLSFMTNREDFSDVI